MFVLKNFKNISRSPYEGRQVINVIFFLQICNEVPGRGRTRARGDCRIPHLYPMFMIVFDGISTGTMEHRFVSNVYDCGSLLIIYFYKYY